MSEDTQMQNEPKPPFNEKQQISPGVEESMNIPPRWQAGRYQSANKLRGRKALITGGDSGIGRAVALLFAREGADVAITFLPAELSDAVKTKELVEAEGQECILIDGDLIDEDFCRHAVDTAARDLGGLDILVSNAAYQRRKTSMEDLTFEEWDKTFKTNIYAYFHLVKAALKYLPAGSSIIATSSETAFMGPKELPDYSATKGAINTFTKSLAKMLIEKGIRANVVAPGPVWTPLNPADQGTGEQKIRQFGEKQPIQRPAQPEEIAPLYVFLASDADSSYVTGAIIPETGGLPIN
jgi:NAD(P)-dependent dehydrogenase (short-subunit alcohol dehydrogenase family)